MTAVQGGYRLLWREAETRIFPTLVEPGIGLVPCRLPGICRFTGAITAGSRFPSGELFNLSMLQPDALKRNMVLSDLVSGPGAASTAPWPPSPSAGFWPGLPGPPPFPAR